MRAPLSPPLAGDHAHLLPLPQMPGLPPLLVGCVDHVEDVPEAEVQALAGQPRVSALVVVKQSSATQQQQLRVVLAPRTGRAGVPGGLPDIEGPPLVHPQGARTRADAAAHHLLPQLVDLGLEAAVFCTTSKHTSAHGPHRGAGAPPDGVRRSQTPAPTTQVVLGSSWWKSRVLQEALLQLRQQLLLRWDNKTGPGQDSKAEDFVSRTTV